MKAFPLCPLWRLTPPKNNKKSLTRRRFALEMLKMKVEPTMCMKTKGAVTKCHALGEPGSANLTQIDRILQSWRRQFVVNCNPRRVFRKEVPYLFRTVAGRTRVCRSPFRDLTPVSRVPYYIYAGISREVYENKGTRKSQMGWS